MYTIHTWCTIYVIIAKTVNHNGNYIGHRRDKHAKKTHLSHLINNQVAKQQLNADIIMMIKTIIISTSSIVGAGTLTPRHLLLIAGIILLVELHTNIRRHVAV